MSSRLQSRHRERRPPRPAPAGQLLGPYELVRRIGAGGMAEVWLARQACFEGFSREVVVKRILPQLSGDPRFVQMLFNEARIAARLSHPNIVSIFDVGEDNDTYYLAMEHVHGVDLHEVMNRLRATRSKLRPELALRIVIECCKALAYAHQREGGRVIHRDVSPSNILIGFDGTVKLADFGIAKATDEVSLTQPGMLKGKFSYMSPEQATGQELDPRSDLFSLGLVIYELLSGARPYKRKNELESLRAAITCKIPPLSKLTPIAPELEALVMKALAKSRELRYRDAREFQLAAERLLVHQQWVASSIHLAREMARLFPSLTPDKSLVPSDEVAVKTITEPGRRYTAEEFSTSPMPPMALLPPPLPAALSGEKPTITLAPRRRWRRVPLLAGMAAVLVLGLVVAKRSSAAPMAEAWLSSLTRALPTATAPQAQGTTGQLSVITDPPADVYLRNRKLGTAPLKELRLPAGRQTLRLVNRDAHVEQLVTVEIRPGQSSALNVSW